MINVNNGYGVLRTLRTSSFCDFHLTHRIHESILSSVLRVSMSGVTTVSVSCPHDSVSCHLSLWCYAAQKGTSSMELIVIPCLVWRTDPASSFEQPEFTVPKWVQCDPIQTDSWLRKQIVIYPLNVWTENEQNFRRNKSVCINKKRRCSS